jgi:Domain of unknown function (DUF4283)
MHTVRSRRNALVCFTCGRLGHRSNHYQATTMFQPQPSKSSPNAITKANSLPMIKFYPNPANKKFHETIKYSLVFHYDLDLGPIYVQTYLQQMFSVPGWNYMARTLSRKNLLIEPPNDDWRAKILSKGEIVLGSVQFVVEPYEFSKFDGGSDPPLIWINITGLPSHLWNEKEFKRIGLELGGFFVEADSRSWEHVDLSILRIKVGVKSKEVVLSCRNMFFVDEDGTHKFYDLLFQVDDEIDFQCTK